MYAIDFIVTELLLIQIIQEILLKKGYCKEIVYT